VPEYDLKRVKKMSDAWKKDRSKSLVILNILGYLPPMIFIMLSMLGNFKAGIIAALACSAVLAGIIAKYHSLKSINIVFPSFYLVLTMMLYASPPSAELLSGYAGALLWGAFALMTLASLILRNPLTLQHAREQVIEAIWETPAFISVNYVLTGIFAAVFSVNTVISAIWNTSLIILPVSFALLGVALGLTKVLPNRWVPYHMKKHGVEVRPKDLDKLPLRMIFGGMVAGFDEEKAKGWETVIQYPITSEGGGDFYIEIKGERCKLFEGKAEKAKLIIKANREDWVAITEGKLDGTKAFMEGKLKAEGDMNDLLKMQEVFQTELTQCPYTLC
jgi:putative sterol carrier protein